MKYISKKPLWYSSVRLEMKTSISLTQQLTVNVQMCHHLHWYIILQVMGSSFEVSDVSSRRHLLILMRTSLQDLLLCCCSKCLESEKKHTHHLKQTLPMTHLSTDCNRYVHEIFIFIYSPCFVFHHNFWFLAPYCCTKFASLCVLYLTLQFGWWIWKHPVYCGNT